MWGILTARSFRSVVFLCNALNARALHVPCASCNAEPGLLAASALVYPSAGSLTCTRALCVRYIQGARVERDMCGPAIHNISALIYYIRSEEWCNKEANSTEDSRALPSKLAWRYAPRKSHAWFRCYRRNTQHISRSSSAATSERRHMHFARVAQKMMRA